MSIKCPTECNCVWRSGKRTADCSGAKNLHRIPQLRKDTQVVDLSGNKLNLLVDKAFQKLGLTHLQKIFLVR